MVELQMRHIGAALAGGKLATRLRLRALQRAERGLPSLGHDELVQAQRAVFDEAQTLAHLDLKSDEPHKSPVVETATAAATDCEMLAGETDADAVARRAAVALLSRGSKQPAHSACGAEREQIRAAWNRVLAQPFPVGPRDRVGLYLLVATVRQPDGRNELVPVTDAAQCTRAHAIAACAEANKGRFRGERVSICAASSVGVRDRRRQREEAAAASAAAEGLMSAAVTAADGFVSSIAQAGGARSPAETATAAADVGSEPG
jgi:hypothetical protein